jgi:hypothetical protein
MFLGPPRFNGFMGDVAPEPLERTVNGDLNGVRLHAEKLPDLPGCQVGTVPQRHELAVTIIEL